MSYKPESVASIDMLFREETCAKACPEWRVTCHSLPCPHCWSSDIDVCIEAMDFFENSEKMKLVFAVLKREIHIEDLKLGEAEMEEFLARVRRRFKIKAKFKEVQKEFVERITQRSRDDYLARLARSQGVPGRQ